MEVDPALPGIPIDLDPSYPLPYLGLAKTWILFGIQGFSHHARSILGPELPLQGSSVR